MTRFFSHVLDILPAKSADREVEEGKHMIQPWRVYTAILLVSIFLGITMQFAAIFDLRPGAFLMRSDAVIGKAIDSILAGGGSQSVAVRRAHLSGALNLDKALVSRLRNQYGKDLSDPKVQFQVIEELQKGLQSRYPLNSRDKMKEAVALAFPGNVDQLMKMSDRLDSYNAWLRSTWGTMLDKSFKDREDILKSKRTEIFGTDADKIWTVDLRMNTLNRILSALNRVKNAPLKDKLAFFMDTIRQEYGSDTDAFIDSYQQELLKHFIGLESVQADLGKMKPQERELSLRAIRQAFNVDQATLARWEALDKIREDRWERGLMYMKERQKIVDSVHGATRDFLLDALRSSYFGKDAATVTSEEKAGYFRFKGRRIYGLN
ncbi:MAG TPA: hypothetical protein VMU10_07050 [Desulfomonilia bacterium]|nr:hypothetical protein [Desulfomonilia bacterium]